MRCDHCPVVAGRKCLGETPKFASFCAWAESGDPVKLAHIVNRSALAEGRPTSRTPRPTPPRVPVAESLRRLKLARECPHRTDPKCGCAGMATCLLGKGRDGQVSLSQCVACVADPA